MSTDLKVMQLLHRTMVTKQKVPQPNISRLSHFATFFFGIYIYIYTYIHTYMCVRKHSWIYTFISTQFDIMYIYIYIYMTLRESWHAMGCAIWDSQLVSQPTPTHGTSAKALLFTMTTLPLKLLKGKTRETSNLTFDIWRTIGKWWFNSGLISDL